MNVRYTEKNPPADVEKITSTAQQLSINPGSWITRFWWSCYGVKKIDGVRGHALRKSVSNRLVPLAARCRLAVFKMMS